jgi:LuxR family transcriptional regulator, maltose regulon positive regulatory protein
LHAVFLAQPGDYMRVFLDEGEILRKLLKHLGELSDTNLSESLSSITTAINHPILGGIKSYISSINSAFTQPSKKVMFVQEEPITASHLMHDALKESPGERLTPREQEVLLLLGRGYPDKKIAETLVITPETVHKHLKNIYQKLDVHSRTEAVIRAQALGLFDDQY